MKDPWRNYWLDFCDVCREILVVIMADLFSRRECPHCGKFRKETTKTAGRFEPVIHWHSCGECGINWKVQGER